MTLDGEGLVDDYLKNSPTPVVFFALEWCEFCWSVRKMFQKLGIDYLSIDLDSAALQDGHQGMKIRADLTHKTRVKTIPQLFVGGEFIGGATEFFDAYNEGELLKLFAKHNVDYKRIEGFDPYSLLPTWLHKTR